MLIRYYQITRNPYLLTILFYSISSTVSVTFTCKQYKNTENKRYWSTLNCSIQEIAVRLNLLISMSLLYVSFVLSLHFTFVLNSMSKKSFLNQQCPFFIKYYRFVLYPLITAVLIMSVKPRIS